MNIVLGIINHQNENIASHYTASSRKKLRSRTPASQRSSAFSFGRVPSGRAIAQYLSGRDIAHYFKDLFRARPERILAHIPHALRLVHSADKSGDRSRSAHQERRRAGNYAPSHTCLAKLRSYVRENSCTLYTLFKTLRLSKIIT